MKYKVIKVGLLSVLIIVPVFLIMSEKVEIVKSYDWYSYFPNREQLYCTLHSGLNTALQSYTYSVKSALALQGDPEAIRAFQELIETYAPSDLICYMGADSVHDVAVAINHMLPQVPGLSLLTEQVISAALYQGLRKAGL